MPVATRALRTALAFVAAATCFPAVAAAADRPFAPEDIFALAYASDPIVGPAGKQVYYLRHTMDALKDRRRANLWTVAADGSAHRPLTTGPRSLSSPVLAPGGRALLEVGPDQAGPVAALLTAAGLAPTAVHRDLDGRERVVEGRSRA